MPFEMDHVNFLTKIENEINTKDSEGITPLQKNLSLHWAAYLGNYPSSFIDVRTSKYVIPSFLMVLVIDYADIIKNLIEHGGDVNVKDRKRNTPLHQAVYGHGKQILH